MPNYIHLDMTEKRIIDTICNNREGNIHIPIKTVAQRLNMNESRIRNRLTTIYSKFGLSDMDDETKRDELYKQYMESTDKNYPEEIVSELYKDIKREKIIYTILLLAVSVIAIYFYYGDTSHMEWWHILFITFISGCIGIGMTNILSIIRNF